MHAVFPVVEYFQPASMTEVESVAPLPDAERFLRKPMTTKGVEIYGVESTRCITSAIFDEVSVYP